MSEDNVLAAAQALREFTTGQLAAYCSEDPQRVEEVLRNQPDRIEWLGDGRRQEGSAAGRWRVAERHRRTFDAAQTLRPRTSGPRGAPEDRALEVRLLRAEETLLECAEVSSRRARTAMAATALTYLQQYVAGTVLDSPEWWRVQFTDSEAPDALSWADPARVDTARVRVGVALARLTESEASGRPVSWDFVVHAAGDVGRLPASVGRSRLRTLVDRFLDLVSVSNPPMPPVQPETAPDRLLSAVAWRRVRARVGHSPQAASRQIRPLLSWLGDRCATDSSDELCRVGTKLPDGTMRVTVYADLLSLVPEQYWWRPEHDVVPGALVDVLTDHRAAQHLEDSAGWLRHDLLHSPYGSDSALIGQTMHVFQEIAEATAPLDESVYPRSEIARTSLLTLLGASPVRGEAR